MKTILKEPDRKIILERVSKLHSDSPRQWGTMTPAEMLWHLRSQLELALGILPQTTFVQSYLALPPFRWLSLYVISWPKGVRTAPEMNVRKQHPAVSNIDTEKVLLLQRLSEVISTSELNAHPLFGKMSKRLWGRLIWKHFDHHLRQFGV